MLGSKRSRSDSDHVWCYGHNAYIYDPNTGSVFNVAEAFSLVYSESFVGGTDFAYNHDPIHNILNSRWILLT